MPPSLRDWLPEDHLAWFVIGSVERLDLAAFYASYRPDGHGRAAYDPSLMACRRVIRPPANTVSAVSAIEAGEIHAGNGVEHEPREVPVRQPIPQIRR